MAAISELPTYPIQGPSREEISMLQYIADEQPITKKQLIRHARQVVDRFGRNAEKKDIQIDDDPHMGEYRLLDTHILDPLVERECIETTEVGRSKEITTTEEGHNTLRAFDYLLDDN
jgi:chromosome segregation and condensation protein ScpB